MKLQIRHETRYDYSEGVSGSYHEARMCPRVGDGQIVLETATVITPTADYRRERVDYFGNRTLHFEVRQPHQSLQVVVTSLVDIQTVAAGREDGDAWESARLALGAHQDAAVQAAVPFRFDSVLVRPDDKIRDYAATSFSPGRPVREACRDLVARIYHDFKYDPTATEISTPLGEVFDQRAGVCQDFAHLAIACFRTIGFPARYVSGYLLTRPPPGKEKLVGADASHAWLSVFVPPLGWLEFDPTNNIEPRDEHVRLAYGRDFADVTPLKGIIVGGGEHEVEVLVDVAPIP